MLRYYPPIATATGAASYYFGCPDAKNIKCEYQVPVCLLYGAAIAMSAPVMVPVGIYKYLTTKRGK